MAETGTLLRCCTRKGTEGSNPSLSATNKNFLNIFIKLKNQEEYMRLIISILTLALTLNSCILLENIPDGNLYEDCYEYYDSRGMYHNSCKNKKDE